MENDSNQLKNSEFIPDFSEIVSAYKRISSYIHQTPVFTSTSINRICNADIYFKCENLQKVGAFKFRGATNAIQLLDKEQLKRGVATHSSGNHAAALALAAKMMKTKAYVVMPSNSPEIKKKAVKGYGAKITFCEPTLEARESTLNQIVDKTGASFIHPYNNRNIIAGQGTAAFEFLNEVKGLEMMLTPVGGGGLLSGTAIASKVMKPCIRVIGTEPEMADDAFRSFESKVIQPSINPKTIADGLRTSLGTLTFEIITTTVDQILTVSEKSIVEAMRTVWERMKIIIEPSSAVPLAAVMEHSEFFSGKKIGIIISGGNVDLDNLPF